jgi:isoaspartyl peptidase/L-asparaginase-like protein (Ntn-hydrolase superfamily)
MFNRRKFLSSSILASIGIGFVQCNNNSKTQSLNSSNHSNQTSNARPITISTWNHGLEANNVAWQILKNKGTSLDAVEQGVRIVEADPKGTSVGIGGTPDRDGHVTLDACIMNENGDAGAVSFLENILHPISVARKVMEETPHVMLTGEGALQFAKQQGFEEVNLLTKKSKEDWEKWCIKKEYQPIVNSENHDTISQMALDSKGNLSGACTTSGLGYKMHGRVGDSPIIGASLFVDNEVGAACATGMGELVMTTLGSFLIVELMRNGRSPEEACKEAIMRIIKKYGFKKYQVGYLAINKKGEYGAYAIQKGFTYAVCIDGKNELMASDFHYAPSKKEE